jgi:hypothetical protein
MEKLKLKINEKSEVQRLSEEKAVIGVCPLCGCKLEKGFLSSKAVSWSNKEISNWSFKGLFGGKLIISRGYPYPIENIEAFRCKKCKLVIFRYGETDNPAEGLS